MNQIVIVRYRTGPRLRPTRHPDRDVFSALDDLDPGDLEYTAHRLDDGVTFLHVARLSGSSNPLLTLPAFAAFQRELAQRCVEPPVASGATIIGSYGA